MKLIAICLGLLVAGSATYYYIRVRPEAPAAERLVDAGGVLERATEAFLRSASGLLSAKPVQATPAAPASNQVTLYLNNGAVVTGQLLEETDDGVVLRWDYGDVDFSNREIKRMVRGREVEGADDIVMPTFDAGPEWPHTHDVVFQLNNLTVLDAELVAVDDLQLSIVRTYEGGGRAELSIPREQLDQVLFRPVNNERSQQIKAFLEETFPRMHWYDEGLFTIVTDSTPPTVKGYRRVIRRLSSEFYLTFYPLLKGRSAQTQVYLVIFDDWERYIDYALTDGVPGWQAVGYFLPEDKVLYLFNMLGDRFSDLLHEAFLGKARRSITQVVGSMKGSFNKRYHIFLEGMASDVRKKFERADGIIRSGYRQVTEDTLRHELTHAIFHNFGLQTIVVSTMTKDVEELAKKKRAYLTSTDVKKKRQLLMELLNPEAKEPIEMEASNSWVVEGLATYMERSPVGQLHDDRLQQFQQASLEKHLLPLEFLNTFKLGSFPGVTHQAALDAYAQSWALVYFLMHRHPEAFLGFLERLANETPREGEELGWLLAALGTDLRNLEGEFRDYMAKYPSMDPVWLRQYDAFIEIFGTL